MKSAQLATAIAKAALTKKAYDVAVLDLRQLPAVTDFFVICSADSDIQVKAIASAVEDGLGKQGVNPWHREAGSLHWYVLDYVDVVLHIFHKTTRAFYNLERLWGDARIRRIGDEGAVAAKRSPARARRRSEKHTAS